MTAIQMNNETRVRGMMADKIHAAFPFSVDKLPLRGPDNEFTPHYGLFRSDGGCVGEAVRRGYEPHTVDDIAVLAEAAADAFGEGADVNCLWLGDAHHVTISPSKERRVSIFGTKDNIWPRLIVSAGYDGSAFLGSLGFYRDACRNMAIVRPAGIVVNERIRHTHSLRSKVDELREQFHQLAARWDGVAETARRMEATPVVLADFLREVYPLPEEASRKTVESYHRRTEKIVRRIMRERFQTGRLQGVVNQVTAWEAFNGVQGYVQHDQTRHGRPGEFARAVMALKDAAVQRAHDLALSLAS